MTSDEWHGILSLLTLVILADKRVYKEEVDTFVQTVKHLNDTISPEIFMTDGMAFDWFKSNKERIGNLLVGANVDQNIQRLIRDTRNVPNKSAVIEAMQTIAEADSDFHKNEQTIIDKCMAGWKLAA